MRSGTCTSRARTARRIEAAANNRKVPMRAPPSTKSFPAPKTRVLRAMNTGSYYIGLLANGFSANSARIALIVVIYRC
jgi:hypothetical protein